MCISIWCVCLSMPHMCVWYLWTPDEHVESPRTGKINSCKLPCGCWGSTPDPLHEQIILTTESFDQPLPSHHEKTDSQFLPSHHESAKMNSCTHNLKSLIATLLLLSYLLWCICPHLFSFFLEKLGNHFKNENNGSIRKAKAFINISFLYKTGKARNRKQIKIVRKNGILES